MSTIRTNTLLAADGSTTTEPSIPALDQRMASAWVAFDGRNTVSIRDSYNVSSLTDNGTGDYNANFSVVMANTNYAVSTNAHSVASNSGSATFCDDMTTTSCTFNHFEAGSREDTDIACVTVMGGQS